MSPLKQTILQLPCVQMGRLQRRYKRFLADVVFQDASCTVEPMGTTAAAMVVAPMAAETEAQPKAHARTRRTASAPTAAAQTVTVAAATATPATAVTTVHCPNTGPMTGLINVSPTPAVLCTVAPPGSKRKYAHTLTAVRPEEGGAWVGCHSALANTLVASLLESGALGGVLGPYARVQKEVVYGAGGASRVDFVLHRPLDHTASVATAAAAAMHPTHQNGCKPKGAQEQQQQQEGEGREGEGQQGCVTHFSGQQACSVPQLAVDTVTTMVETTTTMVETTTQAVGSKRGRHVTQSAAATTAEVEASIKTVSASKKRGGRGKKAAQASEVGEEAGAERGGKVYVEVKSVSLTDPMTSDPPNNSRLALFPDTVSERAQKHMCDLMGVVAQGHEAAVVFVVQRGDCTAFSPCEARDPRYAQLVRQAAQAGVKVVALGVELMHVTSHGPGADHPPITTLEFRYTGPLPVRL